MSNMTHINMADEVLAALTHGPTPGVQDWEIQESCVDVHGVAHAILLIDGHHYGVEITAIPDGE